MQIKIVKFAFCDLEQVNVVSTIIVHKVNCDFLSKEICPHHSELMNSNNLKYVKREHLMVIMFPFVVIFFESVPCPL